MVDEQGHPLQLHEHVQVSRAEWSRRAIAGGLVSGLAALLGVLRPDEADAKKRRRKKKRRQRRRSRKPPTPPGDPSPTCEEQCIAQDENCVAECPSECQVVCDGNATTAECVACIDACVMECAANEAGCLVACE